MNNYYKDRQQTYDTIIFVIVELIIRTHIIYSCVQIVYWHADNQRPNDGNSLIVMCSADVN